MKTLTLGYDSRERAIALTPDERKIHMYVIGSSGSGKSRFLESMIRGDLNNRQGFCLIDPHGELYDAVVAYCARHLTDREVILLNLSDPRMIVGCNPFRRSPDGDISVQVDARVTATMHAWGVQNTDYTPTLARTLRLIYFVMLEQDLGLPQVEHLLNFDAKDIRGFLIEHLQTPLIRNEWQELHQLKSREWREEILSAKNRLFKLLVPEALKRFMGVPGFSINLGEIMDQGKVLLVNLMQSKHLSLECARTFGALLVNELFEAAQDRRKDRYGRDAKPYYLYLDEFQNFVSLDIARMLAEVRKRQLFLILAHQYFEQLDEDIAAAALNNCQIKAVFGGLAVNNARRMAEELFIGKLDAKRIKVAIYQTKFWPEYRRDKAYGQTYAHARARGFTDSLASASSSGLASGQSFFTGDDWFATPIPAGTSELTSSGRNLIHGKASTDTEIDTLSQSEVDLPILIPVPFQELSSIQYYSPEEQLIELTAALKQQFQRHCFIQILQKETQPLLVPFVEPVSTFAYCPKNLNWYIDRQHQKQRALPASEVDRLIAEQKTALVQAATLSQTNSRILEDAQPPAQKESISQPHLVHSSKKPKFGGIWNRTGTHDDAAAGSSEQKSGTCKFSAIGKRDG